MLNIPNPVINYLLDMIFMERSPAYFLVKKDGSLSTWGGDIAKYGFTHLCQGEKINEQAFFLEGLLPLDDIPLFLPHIKTNNGIALDIHLFPSDEGDWVLLLGSTWDEKYISSIQQRFHDFSLFYQFCMKTRQAKSN
ncbi:conserved hypothetical protein [Trichormus variabilis ATCC 29413]|uniref:Uncharacterized protein n=2 Tax=Anabaena variabilis TaxID=264691 RepID=Q3MET0_TRIV2|nr:MULTISPECIES: hypothetical protein [Nostocaceae]ABA20506.1 conserved hypothetical protein [Trichormus variabilis ATCC 29413]MBC1214677.1 hypothetical protein [Trichormus variabilis ARAD]MBC1257677.1 hypothetical protein [Trichormus variabilis V5]MBC1267005.1 hypothetical protein [Trichormus variabilis FSR]MBC1300849.1 hypothetical protein [Trichormus variabilis N2B]